MFEYFPGCRLALIIGSSYSWQLFRFAAGGILVEEFKSIWIISELLKYAWGSVLNRKHALFANVVVELRQLM